MISFKENWNGILRNMLASYCYRKKCVPNSLVFPFYWWEDGAPIGHNKPLPNKYQHKLQRNYNNEKL